MPFFSLKEFDPMKCSRDVILLANLQAGPRLLHWSQMEKKKLCFDFFLTTVFVYLYHFIFTKVWKHFATVGLDTIWVKTKWKKVQPTVNIALNGQYSTCNDYLILWKHEYMNGNFGTLWIMYTKRKIIIIIRDAPHHNLHLHFTFLYVG